jgi:hypothetical protein
MTTSLSHPAVRNASASNNGPNPAGGVPAGFALAVTNVTLTEIIVRQIAHVLPWNFTHACGSVYLAA